MLALPGDDTEATVSEALRLWAAVAFPIDGEGTRDRGRYSRDPSAYRARIEHQRHLALFGRSLCVGGRSRYFRAGGFGSGRGSRATIFVSRIDLAIDKRLHALGDEPLEHRLRGKAAIANAKLAYAGYEGLNSSPRWQALAQCGANTQRLLWASTGAKNPAYKDTMYADALIGRDTVDTMPPATLDAFRDHGEAVTLA